MRFTIHRYESAASTNDLAIRMAEQGAPEGTVIIAREQTAGRGRRGRSWLSPSGGLYLSAILRPDLPFEQLWQMAFVASVAAAEAVGDVSGLPARIKWPNDVLINGRKVCGILVEAQPACLRRASRQLKQIPDAGYRMPEPQSAICNPKSVIVGVGINVNVPEFPPEIAQEATSIAIELGHPIALEDVEKSLLALLDARYAQYLAEGFAPAFDAWKALDCTIGRRVAVDTPDGIVEGTAVEIGGNGDLIVESEGIRSRVTAGQAILQDSRDDEAGRRI